MKYTGRGEEGGGAPGCCDSPSSSHSFSSPFLRVHRLVRQRNKQNRALRREDIPPSPPPHVSVHPHQPFLSWRGIFPRQASGSSGLERDGRTTENPGKAACMAPAAPTMPRTAGSHAPLPPRTAASGRIGRIVSRRGEGCGGRLCVKCVECDGRLTVTRARRRSSPRGMGLRSPAARRERRTPREGLCLRATFVSVPGRGMTGSSNRAAAREHLCGSRTAAFHQTGNRTRARRAAPPHTCLNLA